MALSFVVPAILLLLPSRMTDLPLRAAYRNSWAQFRPWDREWLRTTTPDGALCFQQGNRSAVLFYSNWSHSNGKQLVKIASEEIDPEFWAACRDAWFAPPCRDVCLLRDDDRRFHSEEV